MRKDLILGPGLTPSTDLTLDTGARESMDLYLGAAGGADENKLYPHRTDMVAVEAGGPPTDVTGTLATTLAGVTEAAQGSETIPGALAAALEGVSLAAEGSVAGAAAGGGAGRGSWGWEKFLRDLAESEEREKEEERRRKKRLKARRLKTMPVAVPVGAEYGSGFQAVQDEVAMAVALLAADAEGEDYA